LIEPANMAASIEAHRARSPIVATARVTRGAVAIGRRKNRSKTRPTATANTTATSAPTHHGI
jgi:hypothetical protein